MVLDAAFQKFVEKSPLSVMTLGVMANALTPQWLDDLFAQTAKKQYTHQLLFSNIVELMGGVVTMQFPSVCAAYQSGLYQIPVTLKSLYAKLNHLELDVSAQLVSGSAARLTEVVRTLRGQLPPLLPGYRTRILDGNCLASTEHRLEVLRTTGAGPLPGKALVVLDPSLMLATHVILCADGHAQERSLLDQVLPLVQPNDLWIEDRNFCTTGFLFGIVARKGYFVVRQHQQNLHGEEVSGWQKVKGTGPKMWEQWIELTNPVTGQKMTVRRIRLRLPKATRDGDRDIYLITNLPTRVPAKKVCALYRKRWTIETLFQTLVTALESEHVGLGYPQAALFGFCVALVAYNILATVKAALRAEHGVAKVEEEVSWYYMGLEVARIGGGLLLVVSDKEWAHFASLSVAELVRELRRLAREVELSRLRKAKRGPKKPRPPRTAHKNKPHVSTAKLLAAAAN